MPTRPPVHKAPGTRTRAQAEAARPTATERGYGAPWRQLRALQPHTRCKGEGCGLPWHPSFHLDHIVSRRRGGTDDPGNLQWLCRPCHGRKTATADGRWG